METASKYKYQIAMETAEWNTSKQVSAKETVLWIVYKYLNFFFFFKAVWVWRNEDEKVE